MSDEPRESARRAAELKPADVNDWLRAAAALGQRNQWTEAEQLLRRTIDADPENLDLRVNLAYVLIQRGVLEEACDVYQLVVARRPDYYQIHSNIAFVREQQGRFEEALEATQRAIDLRPDYPAAFNNLGIILRSMHCLEEACRAFRKAIELRHDFVLAEFNLGTTLLLGEDYAAGWSGYRHHARIGGTAALSEVQQWDGRPIPGKRLLVEADQGFGDTIQFARFLKRTRERSAASIVFCCQPALVGLFSGLAGVDELVARGSPVPRCDLQISLASLPELLGVSLESAGREVPYLSPATALRTELAERVNDARAGAIRVGLVWQGNPQQTRDGVRSCPLEKLSPLLERQGAAFFSLQTGDSGRRQVRELHLEERLVDIGAALLDFTDTAAVLPHLDLVITVDTATAHLAGALGRPVWTMLCHTPDWRWHLNRGDSPWYPTMRLFRQPRWGDWDAVVREVHDCLARQITTAR